MKSILIFVVLLTWITASFADGYVHGYIRSNGSYVQPHYRSSPNGNFNDNWSTKPNINPYTGQEGSKIHPLYHSGSFVNPASTQYRSRSSYQFGN